MGSLRAKLIDKNRYSKRYPLIRAPKRLVYQGDQDMSVEVGSITFTNAESGTLTFEIPFIDTSYQVLASARDSGDSGGADVNIWIDNASTTSSSVTVKSSAAWTGVVDIFAVKVG
tara:strand:+ start:3965 stop:4309 length:345 start_codon:yes stop_codon:yes gene_type:complete